MPFNGSGTFQRVRNWVADATAGVKIGADYHDAEDDGFAAGLSNTITKDGQTTITQNIPFNSKRITGLADPINPQDASTKAYTDTKMPLTGGTVTGNLDVTGNITATGTVSATGYRTRAGVAGPYGDNWFNFNYVAGNTELWIDNTNFGNIAFQAAVNATDTSLQNQINTKQAALGFTPVQQGGGLGGMGTNKVYIGWVPGGPGLAATVDGTNLGFFVMSSGPAAAYVTDARLAFAGDIAASTGPQSSSYEPYAGAALTGWQWAIVSTATVTAFRARYLQIKTSGGYFTVGYV